MSSTGRVVAGVGCVAALAFGGYYVTQSSEVAALRREAQGLETKVFLLKGKARGAAGSILETESLIKALSKQTELGQQAEQEIAPLLEAARSEVLRLEAQQEQQAADLQRIAQDMAKASSGLDTARREAVQFKQDAAAAEKSLAALREQVAASSVKLNPLNHPRVKEMMGRK